jgi:hypothetical protein
MKCEKCGEDFTGKGLLYYIDHPCNRIPITINLNPTREEIYRMFKDLINGKENKKPLENDRRYNQKY